MPYAATSWTPTPANSNPNVIEHFGGIDAILEDVRRVVRLAGGTTALSRASHSNGLLIADSGANVLTWPGTAGVTFVSTVWNMSGANLDALGTNVPNGEMATVVVDGANSTVEVSQSFAGLVSIAATGPIQNTGTATDPVIAIDNMVGASGVTAGSAGAVPAPGIGEQTQFLRGDGTWQDAGTITSLTGGKQITNSGTAAAPVLDADPMVGSTGVVAGTAGTVPAPGIADNVNFLRGDGVWSAVTSFPVSDTVGIFEDNLDPTKKLVFELSGNTAATTRTMLAPDVDIDLGDVEDIRRVVRLNGGATAINFPGFSNALIILEGGVNTLTSGGTGVVPCTVWNRSGSAATILGTTLPDTEVGLVIIDGGNFVVEVSQSFTGLSSLTVNAPITDAGTATDPNISVTVNSANGLLQLDANGKIPNFPFIDSNVLVEDNVDPTKQVRIEAGNITGGNTRVITMDDADVDLSLVKEINREVTISANATLTVAAHRNAYLICDTAGITITLPTTGNLYATGANFSGADITVGGTTVGTMQMFTILTNGANAIVKAST